MSEGGSGGEMKISKAELLSPGCIIEDGTAQKLTEFIFQFSFSHFFFFFLISIFINIIPSGKKMENFKKSIYKTCIAGEEVKI